VNIIFFARRKKRTQTPRHIADALEALGHVVRTVHYGRWTGLLGRRLADALLLRRARALRAGLVLVWKDCISSSLLTKLGESRKTAVICVDWMPEPPQSLLDRARRADLFLVTNRGQLEELRAAGVPRPLCWLQGFDDRTYGPADEAPDWMRTDVAFIGKPGRPHRRELLGRLAREFQTKIWGPGWEELAKDFRGVQGREILPAQYGAVCRASKIIVGCNAARGVELCFSNRLWLTLGCRGFLLTDRVPGLETLFENHKHLVWYESADECLELVRHYLDRPDERERIAQAGCDIVRENHTYRHRAQELITLVDQLPNKRPLDRGTPA